MTFPIWKEIDSEITYEHYFTYAWWNYAPALTQYADNCKFQTYQEITKNLYTVYITQDCVIYEDSLFWDVEVDCLEYGADGMIVYEAYNLIN